MRKKVTAYSDGLEVANEPVEIGMFEAGDVERQLAWAKERIAPRLSDAERAAVEYRLEEY